MKKVRFTYDLGGLELTIYAKAFPYHAATSLEPSEDAEAVIEHIYYNDGAIFDPTDIYVREPGLYGETLELSDKLESMALTIAFGEFDEC